MANSPFYTATKEDSRPWRTDQDTRADAIDQASTANAAVIAANTPVLAGQNNIVVTPSPTTVSTGTPTRQLTAVQVSDPIGTVTWTSSDPTKATVSASGLVTKVAVGTTVIRAQSIQNTGGKNAGLVTWGTTTVTVS